MPKAARERVASPPAGTALARAIRECLPGRVREGRGSELQVTNTGTSVNGIETRNFVILRCERRKPRASKDDGSTASAASFEGRSGTHRASAMDVLRGRLRMTGHWVKPGGDEGWFVMAELVP
jgi:hypothetical protein